VTSIELRNVGSAPFVTGSTCGGSFLALSQDGIELVVDRSCSCACEGDGACGCPAVCLNTLELLVPGESTSFLWDGEYARFDDPSCYVLASPAHGELIAAEACWNQLPSSTVPGCQREEFRYGIDREIVIEGDNPMAGLTGVKIVLENQTGEAIDIVTDECGVQRWFRFGPELEAAGRTLDAFCSCQCDADLEVSDCPVCGPCSETVALTLEPGEIQVFDWNGGFVHTYDSGCARRYAMPPGMFLQTQVCFRRTASRAEECQPLAFTLGESAEVFATVR
jgi:hypothetical protein